MPVPHTLVTFHAHPDDEALLTGGTLALAADRGDRVILVTATDGDAGPAADRFSQTGLGARRLRELRASALALGAARCVHLGYSDSGLGPLTRPPPAGRTRLVDADVEEAAHRLVAVLREESADLLLGYDQAGGYGHPDHVAVHQIARRAAALTGTPLLEATAPREPLLRALRLLARVRPFTGDFSPDDWARAFTPAAQITHRVDVRSVVHAKRAAMRAHASQATAPPGWQGERSLATVLRLPVPLFRWLLGHEFFHDPTRPAGAPRASDLFDGHPMPGAVPPGE